LLQSQYDLITLGDGCSTVCEDLAFSFISQHTRPYDDQKCRSEKCKYTAHLSSLLSLTQKVADKLYELDDDDEDDHSRHHGHGVIPVIAVTDSQVADAAAPDNSCRCTEGNNRNDRQRDRLSDSSFRFRNQHIHNDKEQ